jgi:predicted lipoprotein with Yx(FWY)xxD motif
MRPSALVILPLALLAAACGSSSSSSTPSTQATSTAPASAASAKASVTLATRTLPGVGTILVNGQGRTLYTFAPDKAKKVTCVNQCAAIWPPLKISSGKPSVAGGVDASMVGSDPNPMGGRVVTYRGWPLYLYTADPAAGTDHGQGVNSAGGRWYVISPSGTVITKRASSSTSGGSSSGGYGY